MRGTLLVHGLCLAREGNPCVHRLLHFPQHQQQPRREAPRPAKGGAAAVDAGGSAAVCEQRDLPCKERQSPCTSKVPRIDARSSPNLDYKQSQHRLLPVFEYGNQPAIQGDNEETNDTNKTRW